METEEGVQSQPVGRGQRKAGLQRRTPAPPLLGEGGRGERKEPAAGEGTGEKALSDPPWRSLRAKLELGLSLLGLAGWAAREARPALRPSSRTPGGGDARLARPARPGAGTAGPSGGTAAAGCFSSCP